MTEKEKYRQLCENEPTVRLFIKDWWLDAICGAYWDVVIIENGVGDVIGALPYYLKIKDGFKIITQPKLTPFMGVWVRFFSDQSQASRISHEMETCSKLISLLPPHHYFQQAFDFHFTNWLPFYWEGFKQVTHYTYVIENIKDIEKVYSDFDVKMRMKISTAKKKVNIDYDLTAEEFYNYHQRCLKNRNRKISYDFELFKRIYEAVYKHGAGRIVYAVDQKANIHCAKFIVWDQDRAYHLINAYDPDYNSSGALSLALFESIKLASQYTTNFDFEGSMIKGNAENSRRHGAKAMPYHFISKSNSKLLKILLYFRREVRV